MKGAYTVSETTLPLGLAVVRDPEDPVAGQAPVGWAVEQLRVTLAERGVPVHMRERMEQVDAAERAILVAGGAAEPARAVLAAAGVSLPETAEALALVEGRLSDRPVLLAGGHDPRGLVYAVLELVDRIRHASEDDPLSVIHVRRPIVEQPANPIRSITRLFTSDVEDKPWFHDRSFWERYLSTLVTQRFNRFSLTLGLGYNFPRHVRDAYLYFSYPFLLTVPGYDVRVPGLPDAEREQNLAMLQFISETAVARGMHFQLGLWTHAYQWLDSPGANYTIEGLTAENHAAYCGEAVRLLLAACPAISGLTFRIHGESGIPEGSYDFWRTVFAGVAKSDRRIELDLHAKGIDEETIAAARATGLPVNVSPKYWAEHMGLPYHQASIREVEQPRQVQGEHRDFMALSSGSRRFTRYGYADLLPEDRSYGMLFRIWPGTQRVLLWGDPAMAAGYGRYSPFCGALGVEICEPLSFKGRMGSGARGGHDPYADASLRAEGGDWEKYLYTYRLLGRLLYNPEADADCWQRYLRREFGPAAAEAEAALANASRILPLVTTAYHPSASNNRYWPEMYTNMPIVDESRPHPYLDTPAPKRFGTASSLDPELFSRVDDFAREVADNARTGRYSPLDVAQWLEGFSRAALRHLAQAEAQLPEGNQAAFRRWAVDVALQSGLGRFFAYKLRAGVLYALYSRTGGVDALREALVAYQTARAAWAEVAERARGVYADDLTFGQESFLRGHWSDRLPAIDQDLQDMVAAVESASAAGAAGAAGGTAMSAVPEGTATAPSAGAGSILDGLHSTTLPLPETVNGFPAIAPAPFRRGEPLEVKLPVHAVQEGDRPSCAHLHYRHVNQAERYVVMEMSLDGPGKDGPAKETTFRATIPGDYTDSPYALQYFVELHDGHGRGRLYPGFVADLSNQPYVVARQSP